MSDLEIYFMVQIISLLNERTEKSPIICIRLLLTSIIIILINQIPDKSFT